MKRMRILGLALVAVSALAVALVGASSASATAKFGECVSFKHGKYADPNCATLFLKKGVPVAKGKFEFVGAGECYAKKHGAYDDSACTVLHMKKGVPVPKGKFEKVPLQNGTESGGTGKLVSAAGTIECTASTGTQNILSPTTASSQTNFTNCSAESGAVQCTGLIPNPNTGKEEPGEISTFKLGATLAEDQPHEASARLLGEGSDGLGGPNEGKYFAEAACPPVTAFRVDGGPLGDNITPVNTMGTSNTIEFLTGDEQGLLTEFGAPPWSPPAATLPSEQIGNVTITNPKAAEVHVN